MRRDTEKICVAVCGEMPGAVELMESRDDVEYTTFSNGNDLYDRLEDAAPFDFIVIQSDAGEGMVPLYYHGCDGECFVYLTADPQDVEGRETLDDMIDTQLNEKWFKMSPAASRIERDEVLIYKLQEGVEVIERDGVPGLRLGKQEQYADGPLQAWLLGRLLEQPWIARELAAKMAAEKISEAESFLMERWTERGDPNGRETLETLKMPHRRVKGENDIQTSMLALSFFYKEFRAFLRRETPPFPFALETGRDREVTQS